MRREKKGRRAIPPPGPKVAATGGSFLVVALTSLGLAVVIVTVRVNGINPSSILVPIVINNDTDIRRRRVRVQVWVNVGVGLHRSTGHGVVAVRTLTSARTI